MNITKLLDERYSVKKFNPDFKLSEEQFQNIKKLLQFSPSSVNIQPWSFTIATTKQGIETIRKSTVEFGFNHDKIKDASALIILSVIDMTTTHLTNVTNQEELDKRFPLEEYKTSTDNGRKYFYELHNKLGDAKQWLEKQVYLNAGHFVLGATTLGLDTVIMEGFDAKILKKELKFENKTPLLIIGVGKGANDDFNMSLPKSRLKQEEIIDLI
ncbi:MAG: nitroreductase family protein [Mycoplasmatales bacterium]